MGRGSASSTTQGSAGTSGLVLECETEGLSDAQILKLQKIKDDVSKLQLLFQTSAVQKENAVSVPALVNGTGSATVSTPIPNGTSVVGLQVPQFLLLQNGQMIAASSTLPSSLATTNPANSFPITTVQATVNNNNAAPQSAKTSAARTPSTQASQPLTRNARVTINGGKNSGPSSSSGGGSPDIQVLKEMRVQPSNSPTSQGTRVQSTTSTTQATPVATISSSSNGNVVAVSSSSSSSSSPSSSTANTSIAPICNKYPLLNVIARPRNTLPPAVAMSQRKELDAKVKAVLVKSPQEFVEWLLSEGLIRTSQNCSLHKTQHSQLPYRLKLGMFSDPKVLATSGGYVWISECCGKKYVSVYSGSIFGSTPIDKVPPTSVLKLIYHWACQTSISNVENWVKVDKNFINKVFQYMRCICSVMLQDKVYDFGFDGSTVELGIVSLGTSTADGTKKAVKVEILGLYDRRMKSYRLFASEPEPGCSSRQRFVRILKPLERVVHSNAIILCDQSVDRNCLYNMNYAKVSVCETSDNEDNLQFNARIMAYLRKHVPKMFQSALSQLNLQQVQLVLDELCWRERYGHCAAQSYINMVEHVTYLTAREAENPGVLHLLDFVSQKPQHNWRYKSQHIPKGPTSLQPSIIMSPPNATATITPQLTLDTIPVTQTPLEHTNKVMLTARRVQMPQGMVNKVPIPPLSPKSDATELEPFYYGQIQGDPTLGREANSLNFVCHICSVVCVNNLDFYSHLKLHLSRTATYMDHKICCNYCTEHFQVEEKRTFHQRVKHMHLDTRFLWCRICSEGFNGEYHLVNHMAKKHFESELPYRCEVCNFVTSIYYSLIDHFNTEHKNTAYVQCHFCLGVKSISSTSANTFSQRMYNHVQKHTQQQSRCRQCQLTFYSKYLLDEHRRKDHVSRVNVTGLQRYKIPAGQNRIMFRPWIKKAATSGAPSAYPGALNSSVALSATLAVHDLKVDGNDKQDNLYCLECDTKMDMPNHFKAYQKCTRCSYSTCCRNMISKHAEAFHPPSRGRKGNYNVGPAITLPRPLYCICGFCSRSGNHLARHLAMCEGGRKSAYPSVLDAMVYEGGDPVSAGALTLANLGLDNIGLAPLLPDSSLTPAPTLDMAHFMSVTMDVDEG